MLRYHFDETSRAEIDAAAVENAVVATTTDIDLRDGTLREVHLTTTVANANDRTIVDHVHRPETGTHRTDVVLVDSLGKKLKLELITKEVVTLAQRPPRLHEEDVDFIRHHGFELPLCREDSIVPDILIGIDHYWDIICPEAPICLPTGMVLCHTRFGTVISGNSVFRLGPRRTQTPLTYTRYHSSTKPSNGCGH
ncbi:unnamed protein product [Heligmosomoides polygyrus]|uniref:DUF1758 domain-containing protein n=1 Tax=Heligmosomoides polygyrus TaxID=6339 RepID=A0A183F9U7_HELPZ|nr:unnamed protein product [Heligmosomoides polygyrus]